MHKFNDDFFVILLMNLNHKSSLFASILKTFHREKLSDSHIFIAVTSRNNIENHKQINLLNEKGLHPRSWVYENEIATSAQIFKPNFSHIE